MHKHTATGIVAIGQIIKIMNYPFKLQISQSVGEDKHCHLHSSSVKNKLMTKQDFFWEEGVFESIPLSEIRSLSTHRTCTHILPASPTGNVFGPADDDDQLAVGEVTQGGECALGRVRLQGVRHGK